MDDLLLATLSGPTLSHVQASLIFIKHTHTVSISLLVVLRPTLATLTHSSTPLSPWTEERYSSMKEGTFYTDERERVKVR